MHHQLHHPGPGPGMGQTCSRIDLVASAHSVEIIWSHPWLSLGLWTIMFASLFFLMFLQFQSLFASDPSTVFHLDWKIRTLNSREQAFVGVLSPGSGKAVMGINPRDSTLSYFINLGALGVYSGKGEKLCFTAVGLETKRVKEIKILLDTQIYLALGLDKSPTAEQLASSIDTFRRSNKQDPRYGNIHVVRIPVAFFPLEAAANEIKTKEGFEDERGIQIMPPAVRFFTPATFISEGITCTTSALEFKAVSEEISTSRATAKLVDTTVTVELENAIVVVLRKQAIFHFSLSPDPRTVRSRASNIMAGDILMLVLPQTDQPTTAGLSSQIASYLKANQTLGLHSLCNGLQAGVFQKDFIVSATTIQPPY